ncbi:putative spermidine/putrescine transport system substrate-binding protein [Microvirga flocculans]|uniref:Putative spermidine/putrescine transport system substrate-binding protein n=1 Tax=Microvirga flocculans TaxID=217168 RepID=A0A7W6IBI8_9HYPH|nr:extracellular solute-binding protein [Microvirga flocculans]MBB4038438.1 putative spermidine/putrescine transport system substrate-binding protein [Microvirga flocculans]
MTSASFTLSRRTFLLGAGTAIGASALGTPALAQEKSCVVGTWGGDYLNLLEANIVKPLLAPQGISVQWDVAGQGPRKNKLIAERRLPKGTIDVACLPDSDVYDVSLSGALEPLTEENVPNIKNVIPALRRTHSVSQLFSGMVLIYNPNHAQPKSYADLWDEKYRGKVGIVDLSFNWMYAIAALAGGDSLSNFEPAKKRLLEWKKLGVRVYPSNEAVGQALQSGEIWITALWRGRAVQWEKAGIPVTNVVPTEGLIPVTYEACIAKNAPNKEFGLAFLNAMLDPQGQIAFAQTMGYSPTVTNAQIPPELAKKVSFSAEETAKLRNPDFAYLAKEYQNLRQWWDREFLA